MIKIYQDVVTKKFKVVVTEEARIAYQTAARVARVLSKHGVTNVSVAKQNVVVEFVSFNEDFSADTVLWIIYRIFGEEHGVEIITKVTDGVVTTSDDSSTIELNHKNAHKLKEIEDFPFLFAEGTLYFNVFRDSIRIDIPHNHRNTMKYTEELLDLLNSFK